MSTHRSPSTAGPAPARRRWLALALPGLSAAAIAGVALPAHAVDGCQVLLCFAASDWRKVPQCVPPVRQVLRDLARGRSFPTCSMSGAGNSAQHHWAAAPTNCPPQYTHLVETDTGSYYTCDYAGAISVVVDGTPFAKTWWNMGGDTVTEFSPAAKAKLGTWDTRYDDEYQAWAAAQAATPVAASMP
jgi:hypothetical protein